MMIPKVREFIKKNGINAYMIPSTDEWLSEYPRVKYLEHSIGFTGSNGLAVITEESLLFYTDRRYELQAQEQLPNFEIHFDYNDFLNAIKSKNLDKIGYNPNIFKCTTIDNINKHLNTIPLNDNPLNISDSFKSKKQFFILPPELYSDDFDTKLNKVMSKMNQKSDYLLIFNAETCCWLLNIRGEDELYSPTLRCHLLISKSKEVLFFVEPQKVFTNFSHPNIKTLNINDFTSTLKDLVEKKKSIEIDLQETPQSIYELIGNNAVKNANPASALKSIKGDIEIGNIKKVAIEDAVALTHFAIWLQNAPIGTGELEIAYKIDSLRSEQPSFIKPSFPTIAALNENSAIIHYFPQNKTEKFTTGSDVLLLDSGGQYLGGTTDITRIFPIGEIDTEIRRNFTLVLKAHISLANTVFKEGTTGAALDAIARKPLWQNEMDYSHGTGHGVGYMLGVHEGTTAISPNCKSGVVKEGMVFSNEPGYYLPNNYGLRFENLMTVAKLKPNSEYLYFEMLTFIPIDMSLIDYSLLDKLEVQWLINYQMQSIDLLLPYFSLEELEETYKTQQLKNFFN